MAQMIKNTPAVQKTQESSEMWVPSLGREDPLEEEMATHSSILAWRIPMDRGAWWATVHGVTESDVTVHACSSMHTCRKKWCWEKGPTRQPGFLMDKNADAEPSEGMELTSMRRSQEEDFWLMKAKNLKTNEELTWKNGLEYWVHWSGQRPGKQPLLLSECLLTRSLWAASRLPRRDLSVWVSERQTVVLLSVSDPVAHTILGRTEELALFAWRYPTENFLHILWPNSSPVFFLF